MRSSRWLLLTSCFVVSVMGASAVKASGGGTIEGGTISFAGALVEPTCNLSAVADLVSKYAPSAQTQQRSCSGTTSAAADASRTYSHSMVHLSAAEPDQVLRYFAGYVRDAQSSHADPVLVTQTYE